MENENKISRRKFLTVSAGTAAALICVGCGVKVDQNTKTVDPDPTTSSSQSIATNPTPVNTASASATPVPAATQAPVVTTSRCPKGLINDPYPGRCRRYIDQNGNGFCDLSEIG